MSDELLRLRLYVVDLDLRQSAQRTAVGDCRVGLGRVDVHAQQCLVADDENGVAQFQHSLQRRAGVELLAADQELRAVAVLAFAAIVERRCRPRPRPLGVLDSERRQRGEVAAQVAQRAFQHDVQPLPAGIDDTGLLQRRQEARRLRYGVLRGVDARGEDALEIPTQLPRALAGGGRNGAHDGENRPFDGMADGAVGAQGRLVEGGDEV